VEVLDEFDEVDLWEELEWGSDWFEVKFKNLGDNSLGLNIYHLRLNIKNMSIEYSAVVRMMKKELYL
jgi:hypothetical protein